MTYEYKGRGLGFSDPRGTCSQVANGETRCFRPSETAAATRNRCLSTNQSCTVGGSSGAMYCCPQFGSTRAPTTAPTTAPATTGEGGALTQAANAIKGILGFGVGVPQPPSGNAGAVDDKGSPTAQGFSDYAKNAAVTEAAAVEEEVIGPVEEEPGGSSGNWLNRYQTHITIASTAIGLVTFVIWLVAKKK